jgi:hypothetical protein
MATAISHPTTPRLDDLITVDPARGGGVAIGLIQ